MQDISTRRSLSTAEYKVTLYSAVDKGLRVEMSCITPLELLLRVLLWNDFAVHLERSMSLYQIIKYLVNILGCVTPVKETLL